MVFFAQNIVIGSIFSMVYVYKLVFKKVGEKYCFWRFFGRQKLVFQKGKIVLVAEFWKKINADTLLKIFRYLSLSLPFVSHPLVRWRLFFTSEQTSKKTKKCKILKQQNRRKLKLNYKRVERINILKRKN